MKFMKKCLVILALSLIIVLSFAACRENNSMSTTFPNIKSDSIPDVLEKVVGTKGDTYYTNFASSDDNGYSSYLKVIFEDTNDDDYNELIKHYQATSIGNIKDDMLIFDWGLLKVVSEDSSILVEVYMN